MADNGSRLEATPDSDIKVKAALDCPAVSPRVNDRTLSEASNGTAEASARGVLRRRW